MYPEGYRLEIKKVSEKLSLQTRRGPDLEGSKILQIRRGLGKDDTPFLVDSNSIIASENVSGRVSVGN